jgi:hypothetical protein
MLKTEALRARDARGARGRARAGAVLAALACSIVLGACGSSSSKTTPTGPLGTLNTAADAHAIEKSILTQRGIRATVACPPKVILEQGRTFECIATYRAKKKPHRKATTLFLVTIQNSRGYVTYVGK